MSHNTRLMLGLGAVLAILGTSCSNAHDAAEQGRQAGAAGAGAVLEPVAQPEAPPATDEQPAVIKPGTPEERADFEQRLSAAEARFNANPNDASIQKERADFQREADRLNGLVAAIALAPGHTVKFYSPGNGVTLVSETHGAEHLPVLTEQTLPDNMVALYQSLRPASPVPQALVDLDNRIPQGSQGSQDSYMPVQSGNMSPPTPTAEGRGGRPSKSVQKHATGDCQHFLDHGGCPSSGDSRDLVDCECFWGGGLLHWAYAARSFHKIGANAGNNFTARGMVGNYVVYHDPVVIGQFRSWYMLSPSGTGYDEWCNGCGWLVACPWYNHCWKVHRFDVLNAENSDFSFGVWFDYSF